MSEQAVNAFRKIKSIEVIHTIVIIENSQCLVSNSELCVFKMANNEKRNIGRTRVVLSQVVACLALDFLLIGLGMSISFVTMVVPEVLYAKEGVSLDENQASWFGSLAFLCQPLGSIFSGPILDYFGRRKALVLVNIPHLIAWLLMYFAWDVPSLLIANALLGIGTGIMEAPSVTYVGEVSEPSIRGILTTLTNSFTSTGIFIAFLLGTVYPWREAALVCLIAPLATMVLVLFVPETPIWLLSKGLHKEAQESLCRLRGWAKPEDVKEEFEQLIQYHDKLYKCVTCTNEEEDLGVCQHKAGGFFKKTAFKIKNVFLVKETIRPFLLVVSYFLFHTLSGLAPIRPNMVNVCKALGMKYDSKSIVVVVGAMYILLSLVSASIVKIIGKRKLILGSLLSTGFASLGISIYAKLRIPAEVFSYEVETFTDHKELLPVILFMTLVCFSSLGIPWVLLSEVFPFRSRGVAIGMSAAVSYVIVFIATKSNYNLEKAFHLSGAFAVYATFAFIGTIYLYFFLPETELKSLEEIEAFYKSDKIIFADDFLINAFRQKRDLNNESTKPMLVTKS